MSEHSDITDEGAAGAGGDAWARLALSLAERRELPADDRPPAGDGPTAYGALAAHDAHAADDAYAADDARAADDAARTASVGPGPLPAEPAADPSESSAWGRIGHVLHPVTVEPPEIPVTAWGQVAGALGGKAPTPMPPAASPNKPAPRPRPRPTPTDVRSKARRERADAKARARRERADAKATARAEEAAARARRRAAEGDEVDVEGVDLEEVGHDEVEGGRDEGERLPARVRAGVGGALATTRRRVAAAAAVVVVAAALIVGLVVLPGGGLPSDTAFRVKGQDTTVAQLDAEVSVLNALYGVSVPAKTAAGYSVFERTEAKALAVSKLIDGLAGARGLTVPAKTARTALDNYVNENYGGNQTTFATALGNAGLDQNDLLNELTHQGLVQKLFAAVVGTPPTVSAAQVDAYFHSHTASLGTEATRAISSIVVSSQATAETIVADLAAGQSFATLASQRSLDSSTKAKGGALGTLGQAQLDAAFGRAAFSATLDVPFGPVKDNGHWYVGLVTKITPATTASDDARTQAAIRSYLQDQVELARWDAYLTREITSAHIRYGSAYQPANPDQPPQTPLPALTGASIASSTGSSSTGSSPTGASSSASSAASGATP